MTDTWEPANQLEQQLGEVLRAGDQNAYFRLLSVAELVVPVPQTDPPSSGQPAFTWPTSVHEGRTHVLAYTSVEAAHRHLGPAYEHFVRMSLAAMAQSWPDADWWLAVNSGLPIEAYLPAWFIGQITADQARAEQRSVTQETGAAPAAEPFPVPEPGTSPAGQENDGPAHAAPGGPGTGTGPHPVPTPTGNDPATGGHPLPGGHDAGTGQHPAPFGTDPDTGPQPAATGQHPTPFGTDPDTGPQPAATGQHPTPFGTDPAADPQAAPNGNDPGSRPTTAWPATIVDVHTVSDAYDGLGSHPTPSGHYAVPAASGPAPVPPSAEPAPAPVPPATPASVPPATPQGTDPNLAPPPAADAPTASWPDVHQPATGGMPIVSEGPGPGFPGAPHAGHPAAPGPDTAPPAGDGPPPSHPSFTTASAVPPAPGTPYLAETAPQPIISGDEPLPTGSGDVPVAPARAQEFTSAQAPDSSGPPAPAPSRDFPAQSPDLGSAPSPEAAAAPAPEAAAAPFPEAAAPPEPRAPSSDVPLTPHFTAAAEFVPLDEEERLLYEAAARDDREAFLRTLLGVRQIWVPMVEGGDLMLGPGRPGFEWYTSESGGRTVVPLFTGPSRMREAMGGHPFVLSDLTKVLRFWPDPAWDLVINEGSPIGATIPGERITALSRQVDDAAAARLAEDFPAQNDAERRLLEARNDPAMRLSALLEASVFLPVWSRTPPTVQTPPNDPAFPWSAVPVRGRTSLLVFTSFDWMKEAVGTTGFVMPKFADLIAAWPEPGWDVSVNPGTPVEIALSADEIGVIAGRSATRPPQEAPTGAPQDAPAEAPQAAAAPPQPVELPQTLSVPHAPDAPQPVELPQTLSVPQAPDALRPVTPSVPQAPAAPQPETAAVVAAPTAPAEVSPAEPQPAPLPEPAPQPVAQETAPPAAEGEFTIMQKVLAHDQVPWYLDKAYDRVAGFVHRVPDVIDLNTPRRLYECLGLLRDGAPFSPDDAEVHVIRWPAFRAGIYRTPFGGTSEDALKEWGEDGWVVEAPPFTGDGFASGSAASIPEYKVESFRLPHGSEMYAISSDASERFVARYDADRLVWENEK